MRSRERRQAGSFIWGLLKPAGFWFLFAEAASIIAPTVKASPAPFVYIAIAGFGVQAISVLLGSVMTYGFSGRSCLMVAGCLLIAIAIPSALPLAGLRDDGKSPWFFSKLGGFLKNHNVPFISLQQLEPLPPKEDLGPAAKLIFGKETQEALAEARRHLISIPEASPAYNNAQALLHVVDRRTDEIAASDANEDDRPPIGILLCEQTENGLRVTLRNNTNKPVRNIRYRISYFAVLNGEPIGPETESLIRDELLPGALSTFELSDDPDKRNMYRSLSLIEWEIITT